MKKTKTSLGIDISDRQISAVLLKRGADGIKLVKFCQGKVPQGAVVDGNIAKPALLGKAVKSLLANNKIYITRAVVSLVARPILSQIVELPAELPGNIRQFVRSEIRHSPVLSGREPVYDFCGIGKINQGSKERVFVTATDNEKVEALLRTFTFANIDVISIEPSVAALVRALYAKKILTNYDSNLLIAYLSDSVASICVFRRAELDFIRRIDMDSEINDSDAFISRCADEISAVKQFYDVEVEGIVNSRWEMIAVLENFTVDERKVESLLQQRFGSDAHVCSALNVYSDTPVTRNSAIEMASITAVGLALKDLESAGGDINVDLIPPRTRDVRATRKIAIVSANVAAIILLFMILTINIVKYQLDKTHSATVNRQKNDPTSNIDYLLKHQTLIKLQIDRLSEKKATMSEILREGSGADWSEILMDIRQKAPKALCITHLSDIGDSRMMLKGNAMSYESIHTFADQLTASASIETARVSGTNKDHNIEGFLTYSIDCVLADRKEL